MQHHQEVLELHEENQVCSSLAGTVCHTIWKNFAEELPIRHSRWTFFESRTLEEWEELEVGKRNGLSMTT
jgi:hypothetical protein